MMSLQMSQYVPVYVLLAVVVAMQAVLDARAVIAAVYVSPLPPQNSQFLILCGEPKCWQH